MSNSVFSKKTKKMFRWLQKKNFFCGFPQTFSMYLTIIHVGKSMAKTIFGALFILLTETFLLQLLCTQKNIRRTPREGVRTISPIHIKGGGASSAMPRKDQLISNNFELKLYYKLSRFGTYICPVGTNFICKSLLKIFSPNQ